MVIKKYKVSTKLRDGIKDIEGETIEQKLKQNDWPVKDIKVGQVFYVDAPHNKIKELCETVFVNLLLYDYEIEELKKLYLLGGVADDCYKYRWERVHSTLSVHPKQ